MKMKLKELCSICGSTNLSIKDTRVVLANLPLTDRESIVRARKIKCLDCETSEKFFSVSDSYLKMVEAKSAAAKNLCNAIKIMGSDV